MLPHRQTVLCALLTLACFGSSGAITACQGPDADGSDPPSSPEVPKTHGDLVKISVAGRGLVTSDPGGIHCGNDGDQRSCDQEFAFEPGGPHQTVRLRAKANEDWTFREWAFVVAGQITYDTPEHGINLKNPDLVLEPRAIEGALRERGDERSKYRIIATFDPTSTPNR